MKKIFSFESRNLPTMKKHTKRTIIRKNKNKKHTRKNMFFNKVVSYLISDCYMYNPLVSPQSAFDFPPPKQIANPPGSFEDVAMPLPIKGRNKKLMEKIVDLLEADCYLYSPLIINEHASCKNHPVNPSSGRFKTVRDGKSTETQGSQMQHLERETTARELTGQLGARPVVKKTVAYREPVKHMVHKNHRTISSRGA